MTDPRAESTRRQFRRLEAALPDVSLCVEQTWWRHVIEGQPVLDYKWTVTVVPPGESRCAIGEAATLTGAVDSLLGDYETWLADWEIEPSLQAWDMYRLAEAGIPHLNVYLCDPEAESWSGLCAEAYLAGKTAQQFVDETESDWANRCEAAER